MKLILAIVSNDDSGAVSSAITREGFSVTKLATTGGFLMAGNTTFISGVEDDKVDTVIGIIAKYSSRRTQIVPQHLHHGSGDVLLLPRGSHRGRFHHLCAERGPLREGVMEFPGFLGNAPVKEALSQAFSAGRFPHALLLQGEPGVGKRTFARLLAQALVCRHKDRAPCGECPSCVRAKAGSHPDIRVLEGSGATRSLSVEQIKELTMDAYRAPEEAQVSVYILLMGNRPLEPAQNKLLKLIEEPPAHGVFLLVCPSAELLLPTIRSRVQSFLLLPPSEEEAAAYVAAREGGGSPACPGAGHPVPGEYRPDAPGAGRRGGGPGFFHCRGTGQRAVGTRGARHAVGGGAPAEKPGNCSGRCSHGCPLFSGTPWCCGQEAARCWGARRNWRTSWGTCP